MSGFSSLHLSFDRGPKRLDFLPSETPPPPEHHAKRHNTTLRPELLGGGADVFIADI